MPEPRPPLSRGEMEVVRQLWRLGRGTVREVHEAFPPDRRMDFATVQTYLRRLESKGYLNGKLVGRTRVYRPKATPRTVVRETINDLVDRLFGGDSLPLMRCLIEERGLSDDDISELRAVLDKLAADDA